MVSNDYFLANLPLYLNMYATLFPLFPLFHLRHIQKESGSWVHRVLTFYTAKEHCKTISRMPLPCQTTPILFLLNYLSRFIYKTHTPFSYRTEMDDILLFDQFGLMEGTEMIHHKRPD